MERQEGQEKQPYISPQGTSCVTRPWGTIECGCEFDYWGNAKCTKEDISVANYKDVVQSVANESSKNNNSSYGKGGSTDVIWQFFKAIVFVCE